MFGWESANIVEKAERYACSKLPGSNEDCTCTTAIKGEIGTGFDATASMECRIDHKPFSDSPPGVELVDLNGDSSSIEWSSTDHS